MDKLSYENLEVWQKAFSFANRIYELTRGFPKSELFGMVPQMRRAAVSVAANIAEGAGRSSPADQARFAEIAYGSLCEVTTMLRIAQAQRLVTTDDFRQAYAKALEVCRLLSGFRRSVTEKAKAGKAAKTINHQPSTINPNSDNA